MIITYVALPMKDIKNSPCVKVLADDIFAGYIYPYSIGDIDRVDLGMIGLTVIDITDGTIHVDLFPSNLMRTIERLICNQPPF